MKSSKGTASGLALSTRNGGTVLQVLVRFTRDRGTTAARREGKRPAKLVAIR